MVLRWLVEVPAEDRLETAWKGTPPAMVVRPRLALVVRKKGVAILAGVREPVPVFPAGRG